MFLSLLPRVLCACLLPFCCAEGGFCPIGWFGDMCMYQCHCSSTQECDIEGRCPDRCAPGYFGPGCQYVDLCYTRCLPQVIALLRDDDDDTCILDPHLRSVVFTMTEPHLFSWFRIVFRNSTNVRNFTMIINNSTSCYSERKLIFTPNIVDVMCDNRQEMLTLEIRGEKVAHICSVYISGGIPSNVVDGNNEATYGVCSRTDREVNPWWEVTYNRPQVLSRITIHTFHNPIARLAHFTVSTRYFNNMTNSIASHHNIPQNIYEVNIDSEELVTSLRITQITGDVLRLCEVETFGETMCPDHLYGLYCQHRCSCPLYYSCSMMTGACFSQCRDGLYGFKCTLRCVHRCNNNTCQARSGDCFSCLEGSNNTACSSPVCTPGTYGPNCEHRCSQYCASACDNITGTCTCKQNHIGPMCTDCISGMFGASCQEPCPASCQDQRCDSETGICAACPTGYYGTLCDRRCSTTCVDNDCYRTTGMCRACLVGEPPGCRACPRGFYGPHCELGCPRTCKDRECHVDTGICLTCTRGVLPYCGECPRGFYGRRCDRVCPRICKEDVCSAGNGSCFACKNDRLPPDCEVCRDGRYGKGCERACPSLCQHDVCHMDTGGCYSCVRGLIPPACVEHGGKNVFYGIIIGLFILFVIIISLVAICLWRRPPPPGQVTEEML